MKNPFTHLSVIPSTWPNRAVRRALRYGRTLPNEWTMFFSQNPEMAKIAKAQR